MLSECNNFELFIISFFMSLSILLILLLLMFVFWRRFHLDRAWQSICRSLKCEKPEVHGTLQTCNGTPRYVFTPAEGYTSFRIPAVIAINDEQILAFCEGRKDESLLTPDIGAMDIVMKWGKVNFKEVGAIGVNWGGTKVVATPSGDKRRVMNPCPIFYKDEEKGERHVVLVYIEFPVNKSVKELIIGKKFEQKVYCIIGTIVEGSETLSWSKPTDITGILDKMDPEPLIYVTGPGHGIQLSSGRLVVSGYVQYKKSDKRSRMDRILPFRNTVCNNCLIYSDDGGKTWMPGAVIESAEDKHGYHVHANECQVVECSPNNLYVNSRTREPGENRQGAFSKDGGDHFTAGELDSIYEPSGLPRLLVGLIPQPLVCLFYGSGCEGSMVGADPQFSGECTKKLIFCNPADKSKRKNLSLRVSVDGGNTWSEPRTLNPGPSAYSDMVVLRRSTQPGSKQYVGCLYESSSCIVLDFVDIDKLPAVVPE